MCVHVWHWSVPEQQEVSLLRSLSGWQKTCREQDVECPGTGRRPYALLTQRYHLPSELVTRGPGPAAEAGSQHPSKVVRKVRARRM